jgi:hypothetical protein
MPSVPDSVHFLKDSMHSAQEIDRLVGRQVGPNVLNIRRTTLELELPEDLERFQLPRGVDERLHGLRDRPGSR